MVSYKIIKDHGGTIKVYSEVNKGTRFDLTLPLAKQKTNHHNVIQEG